MNAQKISLVVLLVLMAEALNAFGQFSFKKAINKTKVPGSLDVMAYLSFFGSILTAPWVWLGLCVMTAGLAVWLMALSSGDLSFVYPMGSLQFILVLFIARFFLKEKVDKVRIMGTLLVAWGIFLIAIS